MPKDFKAVDQINYEPENVNATDYAGISVIIKSFACFYMNK